MEEKKKNNKCSTCGHATHNDVINIELWRTKLGLRGNSMVGIKNKEEALSVISFLTKALNTITSEVLKREYGAGIGTRELSVSKEDYEKFKNDGTADIGKLFDQTSVNKKDDDNSSEAIF